LRCQDKNLLPQAYHLRSVVTIHLHISHQYQIVKELMQTTRERRKAKDSTPQSPYSGYSVPQIATVRRRKCGTGPFDEYWLNVDCCGLVCAGLTYCLHFYGIYAVCFVLIPPWMSNTTEEVRYMSIIGHLHRVVFTAIACMACISHFKAMTTDPGAVPPDASPLEEKSKIVDEEGTELIISPKHKGRRLCRRCKAFKPQRAHHCSICQRCIIKMDHHCPWVNNCVGIGNHKYFLLFLFYTFLSCIYSMTLVVFRFVLCMKMSHHLDGHRHHLHCFDQPTHLLHILGLMVESLLFGLFTSCMMFDQWDVVISNVTHIDKLKGDAGGERVGGITEVFGMLAKGNSTAPRLDWLLPSGTICFSNGIKDEILGYCRPCGSSSTMNNSASMEMASSGRIVRSIAEIV